MKNKADDFIGMTFPTPRGGVLTVIDVLPKVKGKAKQYICECSICSKDEDLWYKGSITTVKNGLVYGRIPCGCRKNTQWSARQYNVKIHRECVTRGYEFLGFCSTKVKSDTRIFLKCKSDDHEWQPVINKFLAGDGCIKCSNNNVKLHTTKADSNKILSFMGSGAYIEGTIFKRNPSKVDSRGHLQYWDYICPKCSTDDYVSNGLCTGLFTNHSSNLQKGKLSCRCSLNYQWTKEQREYQINKIFINENLKSFSWVDSYKNVRSKFTWKCRFGHNNKTSVTGFLHNNRRCKTCSDEAGDWGYYPDRVDENDNLYLLLFKSGTEIFIKVGRSFDINGRMKEFYKHYEDVSVIVTYQNNHQVVYDTEQSIHKQLKLLDYHHKPEIKFGGSKNECFHIDSLPLVEEIFSNLNK